MCDNNKIKTIQNKINRDFTYQASSSVYCVTWPMIIFLHNLEFDFDICGLAIVCTCELIFQPHAGDIDNI